MIVKQNALTINLTLFQVNEKEYKVYVGVIEVFNIILEDGFYKVLNPGNGHWVNHHMRNRHASFDDCVAYVTRHLSSKNYK